MRVLLLLVVLLAALCTVDARSRALDSIAASFKTRGFTCSAEPSGTECGYYQCGEDNYHCGNTGYFIGYGLNFCDKFSKTLASVQANPDLSQAEKDKFTQWITGTRLCLQEFLKDNVYGKEPPMSCDAIKDAAFGSHPGCYQSGVNVCLLGPVLWAKVLGTVGKDLLNFPGIKQSLITAGGCAETYAKAVLNTVTEVAADAWRAGVKGAKVVGKAVVQAGKAGLQDVKKVGAAAEQAGKKAYSWLGSKARGLFGGGGGDSSTTNRFRSVPRYVEVPKTF